MVSFRYYLCSFTVYHYMEISKSLKIFIILIFSISIPYGFWNNKIISNENLYFIAIATFRQDRLEIDVLLIMAEMVLKLFHI